MEEKKTENNIRITGNPYLMNCDNSCAGQITTLRDVPCHLFIACCVLLISMFADSQYRPLL